MFNFARLFVESTIAASATGQTITLRYTSLAEAERTNISLDEMNTRLTKLISEYHYSNFVTKIKEAAKGPFCQKPIKEVWN